MRTTVARADAIRIGGHSFRHPIVEISHDTAGVGASEEGGFIGGEILRRFTVILDLGSRRVLFTPNAHFRDPFEIDLSGLELMTEPQDFAVIRIKSVRQGFPAARARLQKGDRIVSVNGKPAGDLGLEGLTRMFARSGKSCELRVQRGSEELRVQLKLNRIL
jgi:C-terminal processing protease CtpA/Prc